jgi:hypothetical protein
MFVVHASSPGWWCWTARGSRKKKHSTFTLSGEGLVATINTTGSWHLTTGGPPMTEGRHYWEVEIAEDASGHCNFMIGAVRVDASCHRDSDGAYGINAYDGGLCGNSKRGADGQGMFAEGDRIGCLLDLDAGWLHFYRNDERCGPGFTEGVTGPLVRAAALFYKGDSVTALPHAEAPQI